MQKSSGGGVAEGGLEIPEIEAFRGHDGVHLGHEGFALVEGQERHLELHGEGVVEDLSGSGEYLGFVALNVEFQEDVAGGGGGGFEEVWEEVGEDVIEAAEGNLFFLEVGGVRGGGEVGVEHGEDGAGVGVGRDVDFDFAGWWRRGPCGRLWSRGDLLRRIEGGWRGLRQRARRR